MRPHPCTPPTPRLHAAGLLTDSTAVGRPAPPSIHLSRPLLADNAWRGARSFITNPGPGNAVRLWVESRTTLYDDEAGTKSLFLQTGSCKSENTFGASELFVDDNYDFCTICAHPVDSTLLCAACQLSARLRL